MQIANDGLAEVKDISSLKIFLRIEQVNIFQWAVKRVRHGVGRPFLRPL